MSLKDSQNATSSAGSAAGRSHSSSPDGRKDAQSGPARVPVNRFRALGLRQGESDPRHLWPAFFQLIEECRPPTIFGEQVAGALGREWLAAVRLDLEGIGYAVGGADLCGCERRGAAHQATTLLGGRHHSRGNQTERPALERQR